MGIEVEGLEELIKLTDEMTLDPSDERAAMKKAIKPVATRLKEDTPKGHTGKLSEIEESVKTETFATIGIVKSKAFWDIFNNFGTSKQKKNVGYFDRSIDSTIDQAIGILGTELFKRIK